MRLANRYELLESIGQGAMGVVYRALDHLTGQTVALKRIRLEVVDGSSSSTSDHDHHVRVSLSREFRTLAALRHPHIVRVIDYGFDQERQPFFTMDLLEAARPITQAHPDDDPIRLLSELLQALAYLHRQQIVHRDLKPANVLIDPQGRVKVLDFGLAVDREDTDEITAGTLSYMPPEVIQGERVTSRADLYAVGVIAYELLSGRHPFIRDNTTSLIHDILTENPDLTLLPQTLTQVIGRLLAKIPEERFPSAEVTLKALSEALDQPLAIETVEIRESFLQAPAFIGRDHELRQLRRALKGLSEGQGSAWLIGGESGVGKSRLLDELRIHALVQGITVLRGQAVTGGVPYQLWRDVIRALALFSPLNEFEIGVLKDLIPDIEKLLHREVSPIPTLDRKATLDRLFSTIIGLFRRQTEPILLILEDLQWAGESLELLKGLSRWVSPLPLLIVGSYRDDEMPQLPTYFHGVMTMRLGRFSDQTITALSGAMLGEIGRHPAVIDLLQRETEGNAFFMVEVARALADQAGTLAAIDPSMLPAAIKAHGIEQVLKRRIEQIPAWGRSAMKQAAVFGRLLDLTLLQHSDPDLQWDAWLTMGANAAVIEIIDQVWRFSHDKLREQILTDLLPAERVEYHRRAAQAIEAVYPEDRAYDEALLEHWSQVGDSEKILNYLSPVVERLALLGDRLDYVERLLERGYAHDLNGQHQAELYKLRGGIMESYGRFEEARTAYQHALSLKPDRKLILTITSQLALAQWRLGQFDAAIEHAQNSLETAYELQDRFMMAWNLSNLGYIAMSQGSYESARRYINESLTLYQKLGNQWGEARNLNDLGTVFFSQQRIDEARALFEQSCQIRAAIGDRRGLALGQNNLGFLYYTADDLEAAQTALETALQTSREAGDQHNEGVVLVNLALIAFARKHYEVALRLAEQAYGLFQQTGDNFSEIETQAHFIASHAHLKQFDQAEKWLIKAWEYLQKIDAPPRLGLVIISLAILRHAQGRSLEAARLLGSLGEKTRYISDYIRWHDQLKAVLSAELSAEAFNAALTEGAMRDPKVWLAENIGLGDV
ncbi:MAG: tetratricopeptide repeat protein [Anaerolineae bacterium]|jgi:tetratricopeptide (TPR) repeat protein|nr:tetratricopeptide repeat protein [Anaerolineae bacterium]